MHLTRLEEFEFSHYYYIPTGNTTVCMKANRWKKRGISVAGMNYIHALIFSFHSVISVYALDGTISITHGGIETGQGLNTKVCVIHFDRDRLLQVDYHDLLLW